MQTAFSPVRVTDTVWWVGAVDWGLRDFHGYATQRGTTYNAYLILAEKVTLIDTVKAPFKDEMLSRIAELIDPKKIQYIVSNHSEMDHSGSLPEIIEFVKPEKVFASVMGKKALEEHFHDSAGIAGIVAVKSGDSVSLGNRTIRFTETRMLHWPDSMFSYLVEEKLLFSQDAFGMHLAASERFDDEVDDALLDYEAAKYYANILLPYSVLITKLLEAVKNSKEEYRIVAPDHGPIWRTKIGRIIASYERWAAQRPTKKVVIAYDTMWKSTELMARAIADGAAQGGASVKLMSLASKHRSDVVAELLEAGAFVVGSPTINNTIFPTVADLLYYTKGLKPKNLLGFAFGSYGWSGESTSVIEGLLAEMRVESAGPPLKAKYAPDRTVLDECVRRGRELARMLVARTKS
jgi:flavorubredoxin